MKAFNPEMEKLDVQERFLASLKPEAARMHLQGQVHEQMGFCFNNGLAPSPLGCTQLQDVGLKSQSVCPASLHGHRCTMYLGATN